MTNDTLRNELYRAGLEHTTRRQFLGSCTTGMGAIWLALQQGAALASGAGAASTPPPTQRAKRVIYLHMIGAPSQLELFDYKPTLARFDGQECPQEYLEGNRFAFIQGTPKLLGPQFDFARRGQSGAWVSDRLPHLAQHADDLCIIKTMQTDQFNHGPAQLMVQTGQPRIGYPSTGSWVTWGLGSEQEDLPGFIVLLSGGRLPRVGKALWGGGFLPSVYQGVHCRSKGDPVLNLADPAGVGRDDRRALLDALRELNQESHSAFGDPETLTRIAQYEMAYRMQTAAPEAMDLSAESPETLERYGAKPGEESLANNCLLARRLAERDVRFIQLFDWGWDSHGAAKEEALNSGFKNKCEQMDRPVAALLADLKERGLLDDTLVVWSGEFGRTPMRENRGGEEMKFIGRDHNPHAFTLWMAGGGVKAGYTHGETDEFGYQPVTEPVHVRDFHATLLHLLGLDHERLTMPFQGLDQKLTGVKPARVVREVLA
ncbi:DUF1501 domain-containing protein [Pseudobythopirellula maris]|nr:DUF1501 domain-containing protein [Pseudobythopirellula maris]